MVATLDNPPLDRSLSFQKTRRWPAFLVGVTCGVVLALGIAICFGPRSSTTFEDPLTGRFKYESTLLGATISNRTDESEISNWVDQNSSPDHSPGQFGWATLSKSRRTWFGAESIACSKSSSISYQIFHGRIKIDGQTREETLRMYQAELAAEYKEHSSHVGVVKGWLGKREHP